MKNFQIGLLVLLLVACAGPESTTEKLFNFDKLIDEQVSELSQRARVIDKEATVGATSSDSTFLPSVKGWEAELEIFRQLEAVNKPANRSLYSIEDPVKDRKSNLKVRQYTSPSAAIPSIRFYYQDDFSQLRKIEALIRDENYFYSSAQELFLEFEDEEGKSILSHYGMKGFQRMIFGDTVHFNVEARVDW